MRRRCKRTRLWFHLWSSMKSTENCQGIPHLRKGNTTHYQWDLQLSFTLFQALALVLGSKQPLTLCKALLWSCKWMAPSDQCRRETRQAKQRSHFGRNLSRAEQRWQKKRGRGTFFHNNGWSASQQGCFGIHYMRLLAGCSIGWQPE